MSIKLTFTAGLMGLFVLAGCAAEAPPPMVMPDPVYDKFGQPSGCVDEQGSNVPCEPQGCDSQDPNCDPYRGNGQPGPNTPGTP